MQLFDEEAAEQWLGECLEYEHYDTITSLRCFLSEEGQEGWQLHYMDDGAVVQAAALELTRDKLNFTRIVPHLHLPFAIIYAGKDKDMIVTWSQNKNEALLPIFSGNVATTDFSFSPDGKWVVFQRRFPEPKSTYLMPVSEKYPNFLGSPILLINDYFNKFAWTTNPVSFVGSDGDLYRW
ncbi:MAG: hypothetical protein KFF50_05210, partial [Desulfatitalea sp.]|nr:hypothetical protein [Desulfatitalea sp.]